MVTPENSWKWLVIKLIRESIGLSLVDELESLSVLESIVGVVVFESEVEVSDDASSWGGVGGIDASIPSGTFTSSSGEQAIRIKINNEQKSDIKAGFRTFETLTDRINEVIKSRNIKRKIPALVLFIFLKSKISRWIFEVCFWFILSDN